MNNKDNNEDQDEGILICIEATGKRPVIYGSILAACNNCQRSVWVSLSGQKAIRENSALKPVCPKCGFENMSKDERSKAQIVPGAVDELKRHFAKIREN